MVFERQTKILMDGNPRAALSRAPRVRAKALRVGDRGFDLGLVDIQGIEVRAHANTEVELDLTGTGKSGFARALHDLYDRSDDGS